MGIAHLVRIGLLVGVFVLPAAAIAQQAPFRIEHAERVALLPGTAASSAELKARPADVNFRFNAYGRQFDLQLESNDRLLVNLPASQRAKLLGYRLYRGTLRDHPGSWVRLARTPSGDYGALWDGEELYTLSPAATVRMALAEPVDAQPNDTVIFRQIDTNADQGQAFCSVVDPATGTTSSSPVARSYKTLLGELQQATDLRGQIEVALIGDNEFVAKNPVDPQAALLARLNIVDGIFSAQVGVTILATQFELFPGVADPFTSTAASTLLDQLASYRQATPAVQSRGLAHLVTGTNLDGSTVGMAYLSSLCQPRVGVSLSEDRGTSISTSALIMAHELGHNFGAPHDGEAGACSTTPQSFLMAPSVNGSSTFSACSLSEMQSRILAATCIAPATTFADVSVTNTDSAPRGVAQRELPFNIEVSSPGTLASKNVRVSLQLPAGFVVMRGPVSVQQCSQIGDVYSCSLGDLAAGASRSLQLGLFAQQPGSFTGIATVAADNDRYAANNTQNVNFTIVQGSDGLVRFVTPNITGLARTAFDVDLVVETTGTEVLRNSAVTFTFGQVDPVSLTTDTGTCSINGSSATCTFGTLQPPRNIALHLRASTAYAGNYLVSAYFTSDDDGAPSNNAGNLFLEMLPRSDVELQMLDTLPPVAINTPFSTTVNVHSTGTEASQNVEVRIGGNFGIDFDSVVPSQGSCAPDVSGILCSLGTIPAGQTRSVALTARGNAIGSFAIPAVVSGATFDDDRGNNVVRAYVDVRRNRDVILGGLNAVVAYDATDFYASASITSAGMSAVDNVVATFTLPPSFLVRSAFLQDATCVINANIVTCSAATLPAGYQNDLVLVLSNSQPGIYTANAGVTASNDDFAGNNAGTLDLQIRPFVDTTVRFLDPPTALTIGEVFPLRIVIEQNRNAATNATLQVGWDSSLQLVSMQSPFPLCTGTTSFGCSIGDLAAGSTSTLTLMMRATSRNQVYVTAHAASQNGNGSTNNQAFFQAFADRVGDASVAVATTTTGTNGTTFVLPPITVAASQAIDEAVVDIQFTGAAVVQVSTANVTPSGFCDATPLSFVVKCSLGVLATGESRQISIQVLGRSVGATTASVTLQSPNDATAANNTGSLTVNVAAPTPPPVTTPTTSATPAASGGGGGGMLDPHWLGLLLGLAALRRSIPRPPARRDA